MPKRKKPWTRNQLILLGTLIVMVVAGIVVPLILRKNSPPTKQITATGTNDSIVADNNGAVVTGQADVVQGPGGTSVRNEAKQNSVVQAPVNSPENVVQTMSDSPGATQVAITGDVNINVTNTAVSKEATLSLSKVVYMNKQHGDLYHSQLQLDLVYDIPPANVYLAVHAKLVESVELASMRTGISMSGHSGKRDGYAFTNLQTPYPRLQLNIVSKQKIGTQTSPIGIEYRCE
jgi:hypothetical protein